MLPKLLNHLECISLGPDVGDKRRVQEEASPKVRCSAAAEIWQLTWKALSRPSGQTASALVQPSVRVHGPLSGRSLGANRKSSQSLRAVFEAALALISDMAGLGLRPSLSRILQKTLCLF